MTEVTFFFLYGPTESIVLSRVEGRGSNVERRGSRVYFTNVFATARKIIDVVCLIQICYWLSWRVLIPHRPDYLSNSKSGFHATSYYKTRRISVTLQYFTWQAIWHVNSSVKVHSLSQSHVWTLAVSLNCEKKSWPQNKRKFWRGLLYNCFPSGWNTLCRSSSSSPRLNTSTKKLPKIPRNGAEIYQERILLGIEGHLLTSSGCFLTLASSLEVVWVRFWVCPAPRCVCEL